MDRDEGRDIFCDEVRNTIARHRAEQIIDFVDVLGCLDLIKADLIYEATEYEVHFKPLNQRTRRSDTWRSTPWKTT